MDWKTVPTRLTQNMAEAAKSVDARLSVWKYDDAYRAMLDHAPEPPTNPEIAQLQARVAELEGALQGTLPWIPLGPLYEKCIAAMGIK